MVWTYEISVFPAIKHNQEQTNQTKPSLYDYVMQEEEIDVEEEWVKSQFEPMYEQIFNMRQEEGNWTQVPRDVEVLISRKKIVRLRYVPENKRSLVDFEELNRRIEQELAKGNWNVEKLLRKVNAKVKYQQPKHQNRGYCIPLRISIFSRG